jgi:YegS/Rv2252/BmrU family lipid kinase
MKTNGRSPSASLQTLARKQRKQRKLLARIEEASARLERRRLRLQAVESQIAELEKLASGSEDGNQGALRRALLIFNPLSGRNGENNHATRLAEVVDGLRAHGIHVRIGIKTSGKAARELARKAVGAGRPLVIVAAGDGTVVEVAAELVDSSTTLGVVPIGTMNNVARSLGVPLDIPDACALIAMGTTRHIDMGRVLSHHLPHEEYFLETTGLGLSAIAEAAGQAFEKRRWGVLARAFRKAFESKASAVRVEIDDTVLEAVTRLVTVSNAPLMGDNLLAAPGAKMDDGQLDIAVYEDMSHSALVNHFMAATSGKSDDLKIYRGRRVRITTEQPMAAGSDGALANPQHMVEIEIVPKALSMIVGNGIALTIPVEAAPPTSPFAAEPPRAHGTSDDVLVEQSPPARGSAS